MSEHFDWWGGEGGYWKAPRYLLTLDCVLRELVLYVGLHRSAEPSRAGLFTTVLELADVLKRSRKQVSAALHDGRDRGLLVHDLSRGKRSGFHLWLGPRAVEIAVTSPSAAWIRASQLGSQQTQNTRSGIATTDTGYAEHDQITLSDTRSGIAKEADSTKWVARRFARRLRFRRRARKLRSSGSVPWRR